MSIGTWVALGWAALGAVTWLAFAFVGGPRAVPGVKGSSIAFRLMILPGVVLLWPVVVWRWTVWAREARS